jgi:subtilisin family serine protease
MRYRLILAIMLLVSCVAPARAQLLPPILPGPGGNASQRFILRAPGGLGVVQTLCGLIGCGLIESLGDPASQVFVISTSATDLLNNLVVSLLGITHIEPDILISLLPTAPLILDGTAAPGGLSDTTPVWFYGSTVWNGYASQPAADVVRANEARNRYNVAGAGTIGIIDTGVDSNHPALLPVLVPGYDFTRNQAGSASEVADLNQSTVAVLDGGASPVMVNGSTMAVLDQSTVAVLDGHSAFGHGTMVAGIVHLVAPASYIMPLKAFTADGTGYTSDIIRAVYYAVSQQVGALNMSFSMPSQSAELKNALDYAATQSVVSVAAAGNDGTATVVYPAGFQNDVMGVGSTSLYGTRSTFSNYGSVVWVAAPGEGIISTYPCGTYAAGWGTSFSAPFVTGTVGLLTNLRLLNEQSASSAIANADPIGGDLGHGELDVVQALSAIQSQP